MYELVLFTGGVYKYDEFEEFIEDIGGLILRQDKFEVHRGIYFLREEIKALTLVPECEIDKVKKFAKNLKGEIETIDVEDEVKEKSLWCLAVYDILSKSGDWMDKKEIKNKISCPCDYFFCEEKLCSKEWLKEILNAMVEMDIIKEKNAKYKIKD
ncbi:Protein of unknown function UCP019164 [Methanothermus fervidus DSM 2088]|uniref:Uncharacterized protein n=1 Tax=Methanothermus fervidus (strain ATCC 43054 / DSM 2088 / JCM 10308 / V24 S) TaxID=523846 RepID=E3GZA3_METFV|nr:methyl-coenzyme M reductase family protein [Methanothermus fervidus]ADP77635.1 Protein of unknown function UCP019164 [Methanothermus fervidus DSM 2088]